MDGRRGEERRQGRGGLKSDSGAAENRGMVRDDDCLLDPPVGGADSGEGLSFAAFVLEHAGCGDGVLELRLGERLLVEWCTTCAASRTFGLGAE